MRLLRANVVEAVHASRINAKIRLRKGVKGILTCQLWLHKCVSIINRSIENYYTWYSNCITYDILLIFPQLFDEFKYQILPNLCFKGALYDLIQIHDRFVWSPYDVRSFTNKAFQYACCQGHLDVANWLYTVFHLTIKDVRSMDNMAFRFACEYGRLNVAKWLYTVFQLTVADVRSENNDAFRCAYRMGHQDVCDWLVATFGESVIA